MDIVVFSLLKAMIGRSLMGISSIKLDTTTNKHWIVTTTAGDTFHVAIPNSVSNPEFLDRLGWDDVENCLTYDGELIKADSVTTADIVSTVECGAIKIGDRVKTATNLQGVVEQLLIKEESPSVVLTVTMSDGNTYDTIREKGVSVTATCKATVTKKSYNVKTVQWTSGIIATESSVLESGGAYTRTLNMTNTTTVTCKATDVNNLVGSASKPFTFVNPIYVSYIDETIDNMTITEDLITGGTKILKKKATFSQPIVSANKKVCFAYDSSYGNLTSIKDTKNGFENIDSFIKSSLNITTADGTVVTYYVYLMDAPVTIYESDNFSYQLKW